MKATSDDKACGDSWAGAGDARAAGEMSSLNQKPHSPPWPAVFIVKPRASQCLPACTPACLPACLHFCLPAPMPACTCVFSPAYLVLPRDSFTSSHLQCQLLAISLCNKVSLSVISVQFFWDVTQFKQPPRGREAKNHTACAGINFPMHRVVSVHKRHSGTVTLPPPARDNFADMKG